MMMKRALSPEEVVTARGVGGTKTDEGSQFIIIIVVLSPDLIISAKAKKVYEPRSHRPLPDP